MGNPVVHFEIIARDAGKAHAFYRELFGWNINTDNPVGYGIVDTVANGAGIAGGIGQGDEGWVTFYVAVPNVQAALDTAVRLGGTIVRPVETVPGMVTLAVFKDPEGHVVGLVDETPPSA